MPTYEYACPACGTEFEAFQKITSKPVATCPKCGARAKRQLSPGAGLVFKGSGFYVTDYGRAGQKKPAEGEGAAAEKSGADQAAKGTDTAATKPASKKKKDR